MLLEFVSFDKAALAERYLNIWKLELPPATSSPRNSEYEIS